MWCCLPLSHFGDRRCCLTLRHFGNTQQSAKIGTYGKDASNRGKATGNNQPAQQKDKRAVQHGHQFNDINATVVAMVTAAAAARTATMVAAAVATTTVATAMVGVTDNNQLKAAVEETAVAATETAMAMKMAMRRHS